MRIGIVSNFRGGVRNFVLNLSRGLHQRGFEVEILCPAHLLPDGSPRAIFQTPIRWGVSAIGKIFTGRYDVVHSNIATLTLIPAINRKLRNLPFVETFHGFPQWWIEPRIYGKFQYVIEHGSVKLVSGSASSRISVSRFVQLSLKERFGLDSSVIYHGLEECHINSPSRGEIRRRFGIGEDTVLVLFAGRIHPVKDPLTLLRAVARVVKEGHMVKLFVAGDGPLSNAFRLKVADLGLENVVAHFPYVTSLHSLYSAADIFCLPSINEAFGLALLEAMDHFLPTVVSQSGALVEVVGDAGFSFEPGNDLELSRKLTRLVLDPTLRRKLGTEGHDRVHEHFSLESMVEQYVSVYESLAS